VPNNFLLVPGIGAQGGDLNAVFENALNDEVGVLINSPRGMIYASEKENFAEAAAEKAGEMQRKMKQVIDKKF
jgi:orotidine-5'-phosphate decarboxylase